MRRDGKLQGRWHAAILSIMTIATPHIGEAHTVNESVNVSGTWTQKSRVFQVPAEQETWNWSLEVNAVGNWCHVQKSQVSPPGWSIDFDDDKTGYFVVAGHEAPWRNFQAALFLGQIHPCGKGGGGSGSDPEIGDWEVDAETDSEYFVLPSYKFICVNTTNTVKAVDGEEPSNPVLSDWSIDEGSPVNFISSTNNATEVQFTVPDPGEYNITGTSTNNTEHTDSAQVNVVKVEMTNPKMDKKFKFDDDDPGKLMIEFSAVIHPDTEVTRKFLDGKIKFEIDAIGESSLTWDYAGGLGVYKNGLFANKATFTGLPKYNTDFGVKEVRMIVEGCAAFDANRDISVFYSAYATNHPGGEVSTPGGGKAIPPNYFYYYMQTTAAAGEPGYSNWGSVAYKAPPYNYYVEAETYGSGMPIVAPGVNGGQTLTYIDLFAWACRHELNHHVLWTEWWGEEGRNKDDDQDGDWIPDELEPDMGTDEGGPYDPTKYRTYDGDDDTHCSDTERHCCMTAEEWAVGTANQEDWAYPGNQWNPDQ